MADTKIRVRKATAILREDHEKVKKLFSEYEGLGGGKNDQKARIFKKVEQELTVHARIEEEIFYPSVAGVEKGQTEGGEIVKEALEEHKIVKTLLDELSGLEAGDDTFDAKMKVLMENVRHHAEEEEEDMFPLFDKVEKDEQERVSRELADRKIEISPE